MAPSPLVVIFFVGWTQILLYGFNAVLFGVGMYLLQRQEGREGIIFLVASSSLLFILATISAAVSTVMVVGEYLSIPLLGNSTSINIHACSIIQFVVVHLVDLTAFIILAYRCFNIWNRRYLVLLVPVATFVGETASYYYGLPKYLKVQFGSSQGRDFVTQSLPITTATLVLAAVANALLTFLIAGRMWWLKKRLRNLVHGEVGASLTQKYDSIIAITVESGMIIPTALFIYTFFEIQDATAGKHGDVLAVISTMLPQIIVLAPMIIMVRVGLGLTVERYHAETPSISAMRIVNESQSRSNHQVSAASVPDPENGVEYVVKGVAF
ncbi:hypothetical protein L218DRAFT_948317 [Marasmius fiardii PR-910]|nr:hypothetical protein L218DRAFT_948317 [Marasmius fiardii PR-910]